MGGQTSKQDLCTTATETCDSTQTNRRIVQNFVLIWMDASIDPSNEDCQNTLTQLRNVVNDIYIFTESNICIQFMNTIVNEKAFVIVSGSLGEHFVQDIHAMPQLDAIYIFCYDKFRHEQWTKSWVKIEGVYSEIKPICQALQLAAKRCNEDSVTVSFVSTNEEGCNKNLNHLEPLFMYTQIFKEILFEIKHNTQSIKDFTDYCRKLYDNNTGQLTIINEFEHDYHSKSSIWWYTREYFTYQMLNRALRTLEADTIISMGFFIHDLHQQIEKLHKKQISSYHGKGFFVYRGQGLSTTDFETLVKSKDGLMAFNNFLSTSKDQEVSLDFAKRALKKTDTTGIFFHMFIDPSVSSVPFASIREASYFKMEDEILFSMNTVFRISDIKQIDNDNPLYQVNLRLTSDDDQQLRILTDQIRKETSSSTGWKRLGQLLLKIGQLDKAEKLYNILLEQTVDESAKAHYYNQLGYIKGDQGDYQQAILYYEKGLKIKQKIFPSNHPSLATSCNNIASVYYHVKEYPKALSFYEAALKIMQATLYSYHPDFAVSYNNIGEVYRNMGEYSKAFSFYEKALKIREKTLPTNHPLLAISCNNIGLLYKSRGKYSEALLFYEKALEIKQNTLPPNHPSLAISYNNIAFVYYNMEKYSEALSFYERALEIKQHSLPTNHPSIQDVQESIELVKAQLWKELTLL